MKGVNRKFYSSSAKWKGELVHTCFFACVPSPSGEGDTMRGDVLGEFYGQATKSVRWMPWRQLAMKDVASCEKPRGAASRL
jgi:hypothetical protein